MTIDTLFVNARVLDGTGAPWFRGAVGIEDGRISFVSRRPDPDCTAESTRDLEGAVLSPGFIDLHSHADLEIFADPTLEPKTRQGVTTEIVGQDGFSTAPIIEAEEWEHYLSGLSGRLDGDWPWERMGEYLDAIDESGVAVNVATLVGHGTVRYNVLGWDTRAPTDDELAEMADLVTEALDEGAIGLSTGLEYSPHRNSTTKEVRALASRLAPFGLPFVAHIRSYGKTMWEALDEFVDIGATEGIPVHLSHFKLGPTKHGKADRALHLARSARERGVDFTADLYPYVPGSTMLLALVPTWAHAEGPDGLLAHLEDPDSRERIRRDVEDNTGSWDIPWDDLVLSNVRTEANKQHLGLTLAEIAVAREQSPVETMCDLLIEEDLEATLILDKSTDLAKSDVDTVLASELVGIGSDGIFGDRPHPRVWGTFPRVLGHHAREQGTFSLPEAVRKMTSLPARICGLDEKGLVRPGMDADLVVFDPDRVASPATVANPNQLPVAIQHVLVDGEFVVQDGDVTGKTPGSAIRA